VAQRFSTATKIARPKNRRGKDWEGHGFSRADRTPSRMNLRLDRSNFQGTILSLTDVLPQYVGSLSKYIRAERYYDLLAAIKHDIPEAELRAQFDPNLYATARARYLIISDGIVRRDKLVDFIHEQGSFTEQVKMVMYFLFMFRDNVTVTLLVKMFRPDNGGREALRDAARCQHGPAMEK